ncbi:MAG: hypothetical protein CM1200mP10_03850 [Candidatus Neomarinimicrobiota bacterium]|nr:MAG: hypothetical protein CM1200mP10_03850 [Candidatus Neomarinimicrobiota bacterium]
MAQDKDELVQELLQVPEYVQLFNEVFDNSAGPALTFEKITFAIAAFERTIIANNSRFDKYTQGDHLALSNLNAMD